MHLFTVPSGYTYLVKEIATVNASTTTSVRCRMGIGGTNAAALFWHKPIGTPGDVAAHDVSFVFVPGDSVWAQVDAGQCTITFFGSRLSGSA